VKKINPFKERDLTTQLLFPTISWSSLSQFLYYDREQWFQSYVLGVRGGINPAMEAGIEIGERWATDETFLTEVPRRPEIFEHALKVKFGAITLTGHMDGWSPSIKELSELKTAQNKNKWNEKSVREHGQLDFYALLLWLHDKIRPEDISMRLIAVPVEMSGDFKVKQCGPAQIIPTSRTMLGIATFGALIKKTHKEMLAFVEMKKLYTK